MNIDISRVNLLEKDIEDWLFENPDKVPCSWGDRTVERWIGRQYQLPSGIADLIGIRDDGMVVIVEVKNVSINKAAVLQVCRYADDIKHVLGNRMSYPHRRDFEEPTVEMILFGPSIDEQTLIEAQAVGVKAICFSATIQVSPWIPSLRREQKEAISEQQDQIAARPEWNIFGLTVTQQVELDMGPTVKGVMLLGSHKGDGYSDVILVDDDEDTTYDATHD